MGYPSQKFGLINLVQTSFLRGFPGGSDGKEPIYNAGNPVQSLGQDPLEKEMATHSSILVWRIPWTEEPGGLYSPWYQIELDTTE